MIKNADGVFEIPKTPNDERTGWREMTGFELQVFEHVFLPENSPLYSLRKYDQDTEDVIFKDGLVRIVRRSTMRKIGNRIRSLISNL